MVGTDPRFGDALRAARAKAGASQPEVGRSSGLARNYVWRLEKGRRSPSRDAVGRLAAALDLGPEDAARLYHAAGYLTPEEWGEA